MGFYVDDGPDGQRITETFTCCHCQRITELGDTVSGRAQFASRTTARVQSTTRENVNMCHKCWARVCNACHADGRCRPFEKRCDDFERKIRAEEARGIMRRSLGIE